MPWSNLLWSNSKKTQKMKKLFPFKIDSSGSQNPHIGKVFTIGRFSVTVEDVIAEGKNVVESRLGQGGVSQQHFPDIPFADLASWKYMYWCSQSRRQLVNCHVTQMLAEIGLSFWRTFLLSVCTLYNMNEKKKKKQTKNKFRTRPITNLLTFSLLFKKISHLIKVNFYTDKPSFFHISNDLLPVQLTVLVVSYADKSKRKSSV